MPVYELSITKRVGFQGRQEEFSNRYDFFNAGVAFDAAAILNKVRDLEKPMFASTVEFIQGRIWGPDPGNKQTSKMIDKVDWTSQAGTLVGGDPIYRECALMFKWPLGRYGANNHPQFLRKYFHVCSVLGFPIGGAQGHAQMQSTTPTTYLTFLNSIVQVQGAPIDGDWFLCTRSNRRPVGPGFVAPYLEHRQFHH